MAQMMEYVLIAIVVAAVLAATYYAMNANAQNRVKRDFKSPTDIIEAATIYAQYDRYKAAIDILESGLERYPDHPELAQALADITRQQES